MFPMGVFGFRSGVVPILLRTSLTRGRCWALSIRASWAALGLRSIRSTARFGWAMATSSCTSTTSLVLRFRRALMRFRGRGTGWSLTRSRFPSRRAHSLPRLQWLVWPAGEFDARRATDFKDRSDETSYGCAAPTIGRGGRSKWHGTIGRQSVPPMGREFVWQYVDRGNQEWLTQRR